MVHSYSTGTTLPFMSFTSALCYDAFELQGGGEHFPHGEVFLAAVIECLVLVKFVVAEIHDGDGGGPCFKS
jgi:hypothetical protein